jgi:hypothetical protein
MLISAMLFYGFGKCLFSLDDLVALGHHKRRRVPYFLFCLLSTFKTSSLRRPSVVDWQKREVLIICSRKHCCNGAKASVSCLPIQLRFSNVDTTSCCVVKHMLLRDANFAPMIFVLLIWVVCRTKQKII